MKIDMSRRAVLQGMVKTAGLGVFSSVPLSLFALAPYRGKLLMSLQLSGGMDVTSFADPKTNVPGQKEISRWARTLQIQTAGNIPYAPYGGNEKFFSKYYASSLVINGVDAQTNSHSVGVVNNWSGRNSIGLPSVTALFAAVNQPQLPLAYLNFGGFGTTEGIIRDTRLSDTTILRNLALPNESAKLPVQNFLLANDFENIQKLHASTVGNMVNSTTVAAGSLRNRELFLETIARTQDVSRLVDFLPSTSQLQARRVVGGRSSTLHQQIQLALLAFKADVAISADLMEGGFDTHNNQDTLLPLLLANTTDAIDYLWNTAEQLGIADRLVLVMGSDFGRTPYFNATEGKDHWPIGSYLVMEKNAKYTNRVIGATDAGHKALPINPATLARDDKGVILKPGHFHKALRKYLGIDNSAITRRFSLTNIEDMNFFG